jgi:hypothetical protein
MNRIDVLVRFATALAAASESRNVNSLAMSPADARRVIEQARLLTDTLLGSSAVQPEVRQSEAA